MLVRALDIELPARQSAFLWGARQTGKSSFLKVKFPDVVYYDLLSTHEIARLTKSPSILREEVLVYKSAKLIIIDEIQKVPDLLNEVHWLIENTNHQFILCGSSARQLKTQSTNLLGGRAWQFHFYPLTFPEIPEFNLLTALQQGLIPKHYLSAPNYIRDHFEAYVEIYLIEEIRNEGLVRNLPAFARFLDMVGIMNGEMINVSNIARDCGVTRATVQEYFQILIDTLLGYFIYPYKKQIKRELVHVIPKFYLFDVGVANYLAQHNISGLQGSVAGKNFEHYVLMELIAFRGLMRKRFEITYWRTKTGLEVDFILGKADIALEIKISQQVHQQDLKGLIAFCEEHPATKAIVVSQDVNPRELKVNDELTISILPWKLFLEKLWREEIIN